MSLLADNPKTHFIGQAVEYEGTGLYDSLKHIPKEKKIRIACGRIFSMWFS